MKISFSAYLHSEVEVVEVDSLMVIMCLRYRPDNMFGFSKAKDSNLHRFVGGLVGK